MEGRGGRRMHDIARNLNRYLPELEILLSAGVLLGVGVD